MTLGCVPICVRWWSIAFACGGGHVRSKPRTVDELIAQTYIIQTICTVECIYEIPAQCHQMRDARAVCVDVDASAYTRSVASLQHQLHATRYDHTDTIEYFIVYKYINKYANTAGLPRCSVSYRANSRPHHPSNQNYSVHQCMMARML